jgi:RNA polymerase sigma-70 factor (ECF subfamily)
MEPIEPPDADLCRRIQRGDESAYASLFHRLHPGLRRFAAGYDPDAADDLVQEAFVRVWERRERLDPTRSVQALLFQTVRNLALNRLRDQRTREGLLQEAALGAADAPPLPDAHLDGRTVERHLRAWIAALPARQREALTLTRDEHLSHEEAAEAMGVAPRTVNNHLVRALRTLRDRLQGLDPSFC